MHYHLNMALWAVVVSSMMAAPTVLAQHHHDIWVGRSAQGQLKIDTVCDPDCGFDPDDEITILLPDELEGFSSNSPGFDRVTADQPADDIHTLAAGAEIWLQIHSNVPEPGIWDLDISPALFVIDPLSFTFYPYEQGGVVHREVYLGTYQLHRHVIWFLDAADPAYDAGQCVWNMTVRLIDKGTTAYGPSEPFTLRFALHPPVPGDFDCDGDVDEDDLALFETCHSGPAIRLTDECKQFDIDGDRDADAADFAIIQRCWSGAGVLGNPDCAD